jgi:hypothetical protein
MLLFSDGGPSRGLLLGEADRLESLAFDLRLLERLGSVPPDRLFAAPTLENWSLATVAAVCLEGRVSGHPKLGDDRLIRTSDLWLVNEDDRWARTLSRFYRLGKPAGASGHD